MKEMKETFQAIREASRRNDDMLGFVVTGSRGKGERFANQWSDYDFNQVKHSLKNLRAGNMIGYRVEAAEEIRPFLQAVFYLHDRRVVPYYKYLRWELETHPLYRLNLSAGELLDSLLQILETGDWRTQQKLLREAKRVLTAAGYGECFDWKMARFSLNFQGPP